MFPELKVMMNTEELLPLKPLLVLHGWTLCKSCDQANLLLETLWDKVSQGEQIQNFNINTFDNAK